MSGQSVTITFTGEAAEQLGGLPDDEPALFLAVYLLATGYDCRFGGTALIPPGDAAKILRRLANALEER